MKTKVWYLRKDGDVRFLYVVGEQLIVRYPMRNKIVKSTYHSDKDYTSIKLERLD
jgi:hypothetical protein